MRKRDANLYDAVMIRFSSIWLTENHRVVLVTGASSGIGLACATHLAGRGFRVYGTSRRAAASPVGNVTMLKADVTDDQSVEQAVAAVLEREQRLDIVVNNAGMGVAGAGRKHLHRGGKESTRGQFLWRFPGLPRVFRPKKAYCLAMRRQAQRLKHREYRLHRLGLIAIPYQAMYQRLRRVPPWEGLS